MSLRYHLVRFTPPHLGKCCLVWLLCLGTAPQLVAQLSFSVTPNPVQSVEVGHGAEADAVITNLSATTDTFLWQRSIVQFESGSACALGLADPFQHYLLKFVAQRIFFLHPGQSGPLDVELFDFEGENCCAVVHLKISKVGSPTDTLTVVYHLRQCQTVGTADPADAWKIAVSPNPVQDVFSLKNAHDVRALRVFGAQGQLVARFEATSDHTYSLHHLPAGAYFIACEDAVGRVFQTLSVQKKQ
jgi:hypothetical protein